jgi:hypothetical protein
MRRLASLLACTCALTLSASLAWISAARALPTPPRPSRAPLAGPFAQGKNQLTLGGGLSQINNDRYFALQGRVGYLVTNGLALQLGGQAWVPLDDSDALYTLAPGATYYLYQLKPLIPYAGVFYERTFTSINIGERNAWGARGGLMWQSRGLLLGFGLSVKQPFGCEDESCRLIEPELSFLVNF